MNQGASLPYLLDGASLSAVGARLLRLLSR